MGPHQILRLMYLLSAWEIARKFLSCEFDCRPITHLSYQSYACSNAGVSRPQESPRLQHMIITLLCFTKIIFNGLLERARLMRMARHRRNELDNLPYHFVMSASLFATDDSWWLSDIKFDVVLSLVAMYSQQ